MKTRAAMLGMFLCAALISLGVVPPAFSLNPSETLLHSFSTMPNGAQPMASLISDSSGNLYGTAAMGGAYGVVFKLTPSANGTWTQTVLYDFTGPNYGGADGATPMGSLVFDAAGNLYGTTEYGGTYRCGTAFELKPAAHGPWKESILHNFACYASDGAYPVSGLVFDSAGNLYGGTWQGGDGHCGNAYGPTTGCGTIFELSLNSQGIWTETLLRQFQGTGDTAYITASLIIDGAGNLFGTTTGGNPYGDGTCFDYSAYGCGTVFELSPGKSGWTSTVLYAPTGAAGDVYPGSSPLVFDSAGNLYGTAGNPSYPNGSVFELSPGLSGIWTLNVLYSFPNAGIGYSYGPLVFDSVGNLYGTAYSGGNIACGQYGYYYCGGIFELSPGSSGWSESTIYLFTGGADGGSPKGGLFRDSVGNLYATASSGTATCPPCGAVLKLAPGSSTWTSTVLYDFLVVDDGAVPFGKLLADELGNFYGTTSQGGPGNCLVSNGGFNVQVGCGAVFKLVPNSKGTFTETILYNFVGNSYPSTDGGNPQGALIFDKSGNLYGTTQGGGKYGGGTVFKLSPAANDTWIETVLYNFGAVRTDGSGPVGALVFDGAGDLYGTTAYGGKYYRGTVFRLTPSFQGDWHEKQVFQFGAFTTDGQYPTGGLTFDSSGNLYGTTVSGGLSSSSYSACSENYTLCGTVFMLSAGTWIETQLFLFNGTNGGNPTGSVIFDSGGNLYATASMGGAYNDGEVFELAPGSSGQWTETAIHSFSGLNGDGSGPQGDLVFDSSGNLYGTTLLGGTNAGLCHVNGCGIVYELSPPASGKNWRQKVLHTFSRSTDGQEPFAGLVLDSAGNLYGTTTLGGSGNQGTAFKVVP
jgi:uncharacterized repeat protein (TIGR03803 family)